MIYADNHCLSIHWRTGSSATTTVQRRGDIIKKKYLLYVVGFIAGLVNGLLGSGGGVILVTSLVFLYKLHDHKAHATAISIILPLSVISAFIYIKAGIATMGATLLVTAGSVIGAYFGSKSLNRLSISFIRKLFGIVMILAAIRMMF